MTCKDLLPIKQWPRKLGPAILPIDHWSRQLDQPCSPLEHRSRKSGHGFSYTTLEHWQDIQRLWNSLPNMDMKRTGLRVKSALWGNYDWLCVTDVTHYFNEKMGEKIENLNRYLKNNYKLIDRTFPRNKIILRFVLLFLSWQIWVARYIKRRTYITAEFLMRHEKFSLLGSNPGERDEGAELFWNLFWQVNPGFAIPVAKNLFAFDDSRPKWKTNIFCETWGLSSRNVSGGCLKVI